ncbi:GPI transamidase component Gpi16p [Trichomonascus vanleenenianus]|uniref:GPI-anchor transamidase subunit GPI16 n=1 Tax=Trichomonascus vanleenenianus TaxID=2268995 RepID=UPI003EC95F3E
MILKVWTALALFGAIVGAQGSYRENLNLRPLPNNRLLTSFTFEAQSQALPLRRIEDKADEYTQYAAFPRSLGQIIEQSNTYELHLRFSQGWWDAESWGAQPANGSRAGGIGVELWAWIEGDSVSEAQASWTKLVNTLSGFFCASLNFIDSAHTTVPVRSFAPAGDIPNRAYLFHAALPKEPVCTENLTPFIKMLPCKGKAGISSLLDGHKIFDSQWQGMSIDVERHCDAGKCYQRLSQAIDAVIDVPRSLHKKVSPVPKPVPDSELRCNTSKPYYDQYRCFPLGEDTDVKWALSDLFGREIKGSCLLAENEDHVSLEGSDNWTAKLFSLTSNENRKEVLSVKNKSQFKLPTESSDIVLVCPDTTKIPPVEEPPVYVARSLTGYGQDRGGMRTVFTNPGDSPVRFTYFETLPWYMRVYLHTLSIDIRESIHEGLTQQDILKDLFHRPAIDREQPLQVEFDIELPGHTSVALAYDFDKSLLYLHEYPPDANRGFDIAPSVLTTADNKFSIRTTSLLLSLPTPDFSMPYNVIILTCTVMALAFGTIFNLLVKRVVTDEEAEALSQQRPLSVIVTRLKEKIVRKLEGPKRGPYPYEEDKKEK